MQIAKKRAIIQEDGLIDFELNKKRMQEIIQQCKKRNI